MSIIYWKTHKKSCEQERKKFDKLEENTNSKIEEIIIYKNAIYSNKYERNLSVYNKKSTNKGKDNLQIHLK